jgi:hypothetical protein
MLNARLIFRKGTKISKNFCLSKDLGVILKVTSGVFPRFEKQVSFWWQKGLVAGYGDGSEDAIEEFFEAVEGDYEFLKDKKDSEIGGNLPRVRSSIMSFMTTVKANEKLEKGG